MKERDGTKSTATTADHEHTALAAEDRAAALAALEVPEEPTGALAGTMALHDAMAAHEG